MHIINREFQDKKNENTKKYPEGGAHGGCIHNLEVCENNVLANLLMETSKKQVSVDSEYLVDNSLVYKARPLSAQFVLCSVKVYRSHSTIVSTLVLVWGASTSFWAAVRILLGHVGAIHLSY